MSHKNTKWKWIINSTKWNETKLKSKHTSLKKSEIKTPKYTSLYNIIMHQCLCGCNHKTRKFANNTMQLLCERVSVSDEMWVELLWVEIRHNVHNVHKKNPRHKKINDGRIITRHM